MLEDKMKKRSLCLFPVGHARLRQLDGGREAFPVTGITLPGTLDFASLAQLLTGSAAPALVPAGIEGRDLYIFRADVGQALGRLAADELNRLAVAWSSMAPWAGSAINPFDLAGFLMALQSAWHQAARPDKALFAWVDA